MKKSVCILLSLVLLMFTSCGWFSEEKGSVSATISGQEIYAAAREGAVSSNSVSTASVFSAVLEVTGMEAVKKDFDSTSNIQLTVENIPVGSVVDIKLSIYMANNLIFQGEVSQYEVALGYNSVTIKLKRMGVDEPEIIDPNDPVIEPEGEALKLEIYFESDNQLENFIELPENADEEVPPTGNYKISSYEDLKKIAMWINSPENIDAEDVINYQGYKFVLTNDITLAGEESWQPMGYQWKGYEGYEKYAFAGVFDGNGHTITVQKRDEQDSDTGGVFRANNGLIKNLKVKCLPFEEDWVEDDGDPRTDKLYQKDFDDSNGYIYGLIVEENRPSGVIQNCVVSGSVSFKTQNGIGGIAYKNSGCIENCVSSVNMAIGNVVGWAGKYTRAGGICAWNSNEGIIRNCVNYGEIYVKDVFAGISDSEDEDGFHEGDLNGIAGAIVAISESDARIENCYWAKNCVLYASDFEIEPETYKNRVGFLETVIDDSSYYSLVTGVVSGCGYIAESIIIPGTEDTCGSIQSLQYGSDLLSAVNSFVTANPDNEYKKWIQIQ